MFCGFAREWFVIYSVLRYYARDCSAWALVAWQHAAISSVCIMKDWDASWLACDLDVVTFSPQMQHSNKKGHNATLMQVPGKTGEYYQGLWNSTQYLFTIGWLHKWRRLLLACKSPKMCWCRMIQAFRYKFVSSSTPCSRLGTFHFLPKHRWTYSQCVLYPLNMSMMWSKSTKQASVSLENLRISIFYIRQWFWILPFNDHSSWKW